jgi:hypothetical protein
LTAVCTAYATPPFPPLLHRPIELASSRPHGRLDLERSIDFSVFSLGGNGKAEVSLWLLMVKGLYLLEGVPVTVCAVATVAWEGSPGVAVFG